MDNFDIDFMDWYLEICSEIVAYEIPVLSNQHSFSKWLFDEIKMLLLVINCMSEITGSVQWQ